MTPSLDWLLDQANRKLTNGMDPDVAAITRAVITELAAEGLPIGIAQAYRTKQEQDALYAIGRTRLGKIVTYAKGGKSNHNFGVAVDLFVYADGGTGYQRTESLVRSRGGICLESADEGAVDCLDQTARPALQSREFNITRLRLYPVTV